MNLLRGATLTVRDPEAAAARYARWFDYEVVERGEAGAALAQAWGDPALAARSSVVCRPASGAEVYLRFVRGEAPEGCRPLRTWGWAALEISVQDTLAVAARVADSPFEVIGPPRELDGSPEIFPMQVRGPDDEIVYLTQIRSQPAGMRLAAAQAPVDRLFILVLAASDLAATRRWFAQALGLTVRDEVAIRYRMLSQAFGLDPETRHAICTAGDGEDVFLEFDQSPPQGAPRPRRPGEPPPGVTIATLEHPDLDAVRAPWAVAPERRDGALYAGRRSGLVAAPDGTLVELVGPA